MQPTLDLDGGADLRVAFTNQMNGDYALRDNEIVIDSFCGAGGMSEAISLTLGKSPDVAINHWDAAIGTHEANHPDTAHYCASVYALDPRDLVPSGKTVGLLWASPDCFIAGTLVLTDKGLKPIEDIRKGEMVLTHKGRWRAVVKQWTQVSDTVEVIGQGHYGLITTPGHGFYSKHITKRWTRKSKETGTRSGAPNRTLVENPYWPEAKDMAGKLWATPRSFPANMMPTAPGVEYNENFFYFFGRWLGDGSLNKSDVEICAGLKEAESVQKIFTDGPLRNAEGDIIKFRTVDRKSTIAFVWGCASLARWLEQEADRYCENKHLPVWCLSMQRSWRAALLQGYVDADGNRTKKTTRAKSVSKKLAIGMRLLATSLNKTVSMYKYEGAPGEIEGRTFMGRDCYEISWIENSEKETSFNDSQHRYTLVRKVKHAGEKQVFCLQVDEDESFVADGIVVHNCREFSRAKNGAPRSPSIRMLAQCVVHYAELIRPRVIGLENVMEFESAGPLDDEGKIIKERKGEIFDKWIADLRALGYDVDWKILNAAHYGAPTLRQRFFLQARLDGLPIIWPEPTHGDPASDAVKMGQRKPWRVAAECLDFNLPVYSIFLTPTEAKEYRCKRPLAESTERRIARGIFRDVVSSTDPYLITYYGEKKPDEAFRGVEMDEPFATLTAGGNRYGLVVPLTHQGSDRIYSMQEPFRTITGANRGELAYVAAAMVQTGYGEREGQKPRTLDIKRPLGTIMAGGAKHAVVAAQLTCFNQNSVSVTPDRPLRTIMAGATRHAMITSQIMGGVDRSDQVNAFLWKYRELSVKPVTKDKDGRVFVDGKPVEITDIGMRMITAPELALAQGFSPEFDPTHRADGTKNTGGEIIKMIGNSVSPPVGAAVIRAMFGMEQQPVALAA